MDLGTLLHWGSGGAFVGLVLAAAIADLRGRRIPNPIPLALIAVFLVSVLATGRGGLLPGALAAGGLVLAAGFLLHALGVWGGGDAKLAAAVALWTGLSGLAPFLMATALAGGGVAAIMLAGRRKGSVDRRASLPYGVAIAVGAIYWYCLTCFS